MLPTRAASLLLLLFCLLLLSSCLASGEVYNQSERDVSGDLDFDVEDVSAPDVSDPVAVEPWGCAPDLELDTERYAAFEELDGAELHQALSEVVADHRTRGYNVARDYLFSTVDLQPDDMLECVYTARRVEPDGTRTPGGFNTEHTWPRSKGAAQEPELSDLHHLFVCDAQANTARANYEFGNVNCAPNNCPWAEGGSYLGPSADDGRNPVFEVRPERRGDVARVIFYFALRYDHDIPPEEEAVLRQWHCEDPPDSWERRRNSAIEAAQQNRNPFIDRPDFVERIDRI